MTASFMHCYKKTKQLLCAGLFALLATSAFAANSSLNIRSADLVAVEDEYALNADIDLKFNDEVEQAVNKGFELNFLIEFQLITPRKYWFDDEIKTVSQRVVLGYHALSRQYLVIRGDQQKTFATLAEAQQDLATVRDLKVMQKSELEKGLTYRAILLMRLDHKKLPKSLQVDALGSNDWKMSSQRFEWSPSLLKSEPK
jgi:Domain of unknown function (DUF4390)